MPSRRIPRERYAWVRRNLPIACVDVLPTRPGPFGLEVGLLRRWFPEARAPGARPVWCVVGGRLRHGETVRAAIARQLRTDLGPEAVGAVPRSPVPVAVVEYAPRSRDRGRPYDPRQHAIGLLYAVRVRGRVRPAGGALGFRWFPARRLPPAAEIGFGLSATLRRVVREPGRARRANRTGRSRSSR
jgi:ADP-ribose pyrophosphatase YjhB (NUDIX family)